MVVGTIKTIVLIDIKIIDAARSNILPEFCKIRKVPGMYQNQDITLWRTAEIAVVFLAELLAELPKQKIVFQYDLEELKEDLGYAL